MADVIVKGIKIPYSCLPCALQKWNMCAATGYNVTTYVALQERPDWCPMKPVKSGHWIEHGVDEGFVLERYECSECGYYSGTGRTRFCPECGAEMEEVRHD